MIRTNSIDFSFGELFLKCHRNDNVSTISFHIKGKVFLTGAVHLSVLDIKQNIRTEISNLQKNQDDAVAFSKSEIALYGATSCRVHNLYSEKVYTQLT